MITFDQGANRFNLRIAGVAVYNNKILLHRTEHDDFWALPGGRNEFGEFSKDTIVREMHEEIGEQVKIERLLWVVENFFDYDQKKYHELSFCYLMMFDTDAQALKHSVFNGQEGEKRLIFKWFPLDEIDQVRVYPSFIKQKIYNLSNDIEHVMHIGN